MVDEEAPSKPSQPYPHLCSTNHHDSQMATFSLSLSLSTFPPQRRRFTFFPKATRSTIPTASRRPNPPVIVVGAGLSGLAAALKLHSENVPFLLLEASDGVGGRVRTDSVDGFLLDRGFQIFITAYPEAKKLLDYNSLDLQKFYSGARVFYDGRFHAVADPTRHLFDAVGTLTNPIGTIFDKILIAFTRLRVLTKSDEDIFYSDEIQTIQLLKSFGFSDSIVDRFFRPFFGGVFFDRELDTTSRLFNFVFKCLANGENTLPATGIGAIPGQLAAKLPTESIKLNTKVVSVKLDKEDDSSPVVLRLENGDVLKSESGLILAVELPEAKSLLAGKLPANTIKKNRPSRSTVCLYFTSDRSEIPNGDPILYLNGSGKGIVNNMFFATNVAPTYGPPGKALISVSLIGSYDDVSDEELAGRVVRELSDWFGESMVKEWNHLRTYRIRFAQPNQSPPTDLMRSPRIGSNVYYCGDYQTSATFDGALVSGRRAAEAFLEDRALTPTLNTTS
ncbi:hypothetical protein V2J09_015221 [Rumex salicifolius]